MIPRNVIDEIVRRSDIQSIIGMYVQLKRAGSNWTGLCPFHSEKSPSFTVFSGNESFYCFGCGAGGNVITFIMKAENLDYIDAVRFLADRAGISIPDGYEEKDRGPSRERIRLMNTEAAKLYHNCLLSAPGAEEAREYLRKRQIDAATIKHFFLGYAPPDFSWLYPKLRAKGFTDEEMVTGFLCGKKDGGVYDYFRGRVIYPIVDTSRNIIAFGGRVLDETKPKYLNTSDTPAFKKSRNLFALNYAKDFCSDYLLLCEGYMDVISMHQAGFQNAVATLGTAITEEHARIISKYTKKVVLCYDSDGAGQNATAKAMQLLDSVGVPVRILKMEGAKDPDEYIKKFGADRFRVLIEGSKTGFEFRLDTVAARHSGGEDADKVRASAEITEIISGYGSAVERDLYASRASQVLGIPLEPLKTDINKKIKARSREEKKEINREAQDFLHNYNDRINPDAAKNIRAAGAENSVIGLLLMFDEHRNAVLRGDVKLETEDFFTDFGKRAFEAIMKLQASPEGFSPVPLGEIFTPEECGRLKRCEVDRGMLSENGTDVLESAAEVLRDERAKREKKAGEVPESLADILSAKRSKIKKQ